MFKIKWTLQAILQEMKTANGMLREILREMRCQPRPIASLRIRLGAPETKE